MLRDVIWNIFVKTGDIDTYLCYKKIEDKIGYQEENLPKGVEKRGNHEVM